MPLRLKETPLSDDLPLLNDRRSRRTTRHFLIVETAKKMAGEIYDGLAKDNEFYKVYKNRGRFINVIYPRLLDEARATLANVLATNAPELLKQQIFDALIKDNAMVKGRAWSPETKANEVF